MKLVYKILFISIIMVSSFRLNAQSEAVVVDEVIAIVGGEMIMLSDLENMYQQYKSNMPNITKCDVLDDLLFQKLLVTQAALDSVEVNESAVDMELDNRIRYFTAQFGSKEKFEKFYGKTVPEIKEEFRTAIKEQMLVETVKGNITANTKITPSEVKEYYNNLSFDEVPEIPTQYEIGQILKQPKMSSAELEEAYNKIADLRKRIVAGEDFATLAMLYSEDPGSASQGGAIGTVGRGDTYPDFEAAAFALKNGEISEIVKTEAGYHIIKMLSRKGDYIDVLHILIRPKVSPYELYNAKNYLDSVYKVFYADSMTFEAAAKKFSDDPSKINGGLLINSYTGGSMFEANQLNNQDPDLFFVIDKLNVGELSHPTKITTKNNLEAYRLVYLKTRTVPHKATLKDDYNTIQSLAEEEKKVKAIAKWVQNKVTNTYVFIKDGYVTCDALSKWINK